MFPWEGYLHLANHLATADFGEAGFRSAISRAYYAAYHAAAVFVRETGILVSGHTHRRVWQSLALEPDAERADIGTRGLQLKWLREQADYRAPFLGNLGEDARAAVLEAAALVEALDLLG